MSPTEIFTYAIRQFVEEEVDRALSRRGFIASPHPNNQSASGTHSRESEPRKAWLTRVAIEFISLVANHYKIPKTDIRGHKRSPKIPLARRVVVFLLKEEAQFSHLEAVHAVGQKDRTSVYHAVRSIRSKQGTDQRFAEELQSLRKQAAVTLRNI